MKYYMKALLVVLCLFCLLTACVPKVETTDQTNPTMSAGKEDLQDVKENQNPDVLPERDPNAEYIQNYLISALKTSPSIDYADSKYSWVKLYEEKNADKINTDSWAAIDETGKIYGIVPLENESDDVECFNEFLCVEETKLYKYDGSEVTSLYLNNGETLLRITKCKDDFAIWKYQTDKKYQEETVYTLRVCNTKGDLLFEINSNNFDDVDILCSAIQHGEYPAYTQLSDCLYVIPVGGSTGYIPYMIDLSTGKIFDIKQCDAVQQLSFVRGHPQNWINQMRAIHDVFFAALSPELTGKNAYRLHAYKIGEIEPLYTLDIGTMVIPEYIDDAFISTTYQDGKLFYVLHDLYTGKEVYILQSDSLTFDEIQYSTKYDAYIEQVGDFVGVFSVDGTPCFEPIEGKLVANWLDYNGNLLIKYNGHAYDGAGLYVVDMEGKMTMLSITGSRIALNAQNRIMVVDSNGTYKLYDKDWNQLC